MGLSRRTRASLRAFAAILVAEALLTSPVRASIECTEAVVEFDAFFNSTAVVWSCVSADSSSIPFYFGTTDIDVFALSITDAEIDADDWAEIENGSPLSYAPYAVITFDGVNATAVTLSGGMSGRYSPATTGPAVSAEKVVANDRGWAGIALSVANSHLTNVNVYIVGGTDSSTNRSPLFYGLDGNFELSLTIRNSTFTNSSVVTRGTVAATGQVGVDIDVDQASTHTNSRFSWYGGLVGAEGVHVNVSGIATTSDTSQSIGTTSVGLAAGGAVNVSWSGYVGTVGADEISGTLYKDHGVLAYPNSTVAARYAVLGAAAAMGSLPYTIAGQLALEDLCSGGLADDLTDPYWGEMVDIFEEALCASSNASTLASGGQIFAGRLRLPKLGAPSVQWLFMYDNLTIGGDGQAGALEAFDAFLELLGNRTRGGYGADFFDQLGMSADEFLLTATNITEAGLGLSDLLFGDNALALWSNMDYLKEGGSPRIAAANLLSYINMRLAHQVNITETSSTGASSASDSTG